MTSEYDINLSNGNVLTTLYPLEVNGPDNTSTPRLIQKTRPTFPVVNVSITTNTFFVPGDETDTYRTGFQFEVVGSTGNDGTYTVASSIVVGLETKIDTVENVADVNPDGTLIAHTFVVAGDVSARFISTFSFDVQASGETDGTYTVLALGSIASGGTTIIPVAHGTIRDNLLPPVALPLGELQYTIHDANTTLKLPGKGIINYGEMLVENMVRMTEHFAADDAPELNVSIGSNPSGDPLIGQLWYRTLANQEGFLHYNGVEWTNDYDIDNGSLIFRDPQNALVPNSDIYFSADESNMPAGYAGTVEPGMVIWTENNSNAMDAIIRVLSEGGSERLRVEHDGWIRTTNNLEVLGGGNGSNESYFHGTVGIGANGLPTIANTLTVEGNGISVNADVGLDAELELNAPALGESVVNFDIAGVRHGNISIDDTITGNPLEINSTVANDIVMVQGGGNVGINTTGLPTTTLQLEDKIYFNEGGGDVSLGSDIRMSTSGLINAGDDLHINYDGLATGLSAFEVRSGSDTTLTSVVRMHLDDTKLYVDTDTLYVDTANDLVGINMVPTYAFDVTGPTRLNSPVGINNIPPNGAPVWLEVTGDVQINSQIRGSNQTAASPTYSFTNDLDTGMWNTGTGIGFAVGGTNRVSINSLGLVSVTAAAYETLVSSNNDVPNKKYVDDNIATLEGNSVDINGDTMTGLLILSGDPVNVLGAVTKQYADVIEAASVDINGDTMTGLLTLSADPTNPLEAATKQYVDAAATNVKQGFYISISALGVGTVLPAGWTSSQVSTGVYLITHNLGITQLGYALMQTDASIFTVASNIIATTTNTFTIRFGGGVDTAFSGMVFA